MSTNDEQHFFKHEDEALLLLARATELLARCTDYEATLECIASLLVSSLSCWCTIDLVTENGKIERVAVTHRDPSKAGLARQMLLQYPAKPSAKRGVYRVIETGHSILIPHTSEEMWARRADNPEHLKMIMELGSSSYMCVPLIARSRVVGAIMLLSAERVYSEKDLDTTEQLARCIALAVDNVHMFRKMASAQEQLIQAAKLSALGVMSAGIAHEINNPLTIIKGQLKNFEAILEKSDNPIKDQFRLCAKKMNENIERVGKIIRHVKDFSRQSEQKFSTLEVQSLIESSLILFGQQFDLNDIEIHKVVPEKPLIAQGDFNRLEQVLINILCNAKDAIKSMPMKCQGKISILLEDSNGCTRITISDNGIGIDSSLKNRLFEPFFTTKDVGMGTGLGLSISYGIIKDHRGSIELNSEQGRGTSVVIQLPIHDSLCCDIIPVVET
ncbi:MAG: GAF domain-containing sensor histidine kinase [Pseudobdellovibrionaceae bacterium]